MPDIYLLIEGKQEGPYTEELTRQSLSEGLIPADLPAWHEGLPDWTLVSSILNVPTLEPKSNSTDIGHETREQIISGASKQNFLSVKTSDEAPPTSSNGLWDDIRNYAGEAYEKGDISAGYKLIREIIGITSIVLFFAQFEILFTGGRTSMMFQMAMGNILKFYIRLGEEERRQVRAWMSVARTGFGLFR